VIGKVTQSCRARLTQSIERAFDPPSEHVVKFDYIGQRPIVSYEVLPGLPAAALPYGYRTRRRMPSASDTVLKLIIRPIRHSLRVR
jgi:hypothetical protein